MNIRVNVRRRLDRQSLQLAWTDPLTGKTRTRSARTTNWKKAERAAAKLETELAQNHGITATPWDLFRQRFEDEHLVTVSPSTARHYGYSLDRFEKEMGRPRDINHITASTISIYQSKLRASGLTEAAIGSKLRELRAALHWAHRMGMIRHVPAITIAQTQSRGRALTFPEVIQYFRTIREHAPPRHREAIYTTTMLMWLGGFRLSEALRLSFDAPPITVDLTHPPCVRWRSDGQKSRRDETTCMMPDLHRYLLRIAGTRHPVLGRVVQTQLSCRQMMKHLADIGRKSGIRVSPTKHASAHDFRRTFGTRTALRVHPFVLKHLMRHAEIQTTMRYYLSIPDAEISESIWRDVHTDVHDLAMTRLTPRPHRVPSTSQPPTPSFNRPG